jgi:hypothetical protein
VPYDSGGKRLHFHGVPEEVNEDDVRFWQILLQKSFWGGERKFLEPLMRFARGDVRDLIV